MPKPRRIPVFNLSDSLTKDSDEHPFSFGKYQGETPLAVAQKDPSYIVWVAETFAPSAAPFTQDLYELCKLTVDDTATKYKEEKDKREELDGNLRFK